MPASPQMWMRLAGGMQTELKHRSSTYLTQHAPHCRNADLRSGIGRMLGHSGTGHQVHVQHGYQPRACGQHDHVAKCVDRKQHTHKWVCGELVHQ